MRCPGCGWEQPPGETCEACGARMTGKDLTPAEARAKAIQRARDAAALEEASLRCGRAASKKPKTKAEFGSKELLQLLATPLRRPLMAVRAVVGALTLALGLYVLVFQSNVLLTPLATVVVLAYAFVGLYWILTGLLSIAVRQFLLEMLAFLVVTVGLRVNLPEAFNSELAQSRKPAVAKAKATAKAETAKGPEKEAAPAAESGAPPEFKAQLTALANGGAQLLDAGVDTQAWMQWELGDALRKLRSGLPSATQEATAGVMRKVASLERAMESAVGGDSVRATDDARAALDVLRSDPLLR